MKRNVLFAAVFLAVCFSVFDARAIDFSIGVKGGAGISNMFGSAINDTDNVFVNSGGRTGRGLGAAGFAFLNLRFSKYFATEIDVGFALKSRDEKSGYLNIDDRLHAGYFEVPVLLKGTLPLGIVEPYAYVGPTFDYLLYATRYDAIADTTVDQFGDRNAFDIGLAGGGGVTIPAGIGSIVIDIRYTLGLLTIDKVTAEEQYVDPRAKAVDIKFWNAVVMVGYVFKL
jgi:hypothetical protein